MFGFSTKGIVAAAVLAGASAFGTMASAATFNFEGLTNNNSTNITTGEAQLGVTITDGGSGLVSFLFENQGPLASSITQIYWEDGNPDILGGIDSIVNGTGTSFSESTGNLQLPGAGGGPNAVLLEAFGAEPDSPVQPNGVNPGEQVEVLLSLINNASVADVISQVNSGDLIFGFHVQGFGDGGSESFLVGEECIEGQFGADCDEPTTPQVPLPAGLPLMLSAIGIGAYMRKRSRKSA